MKTQLLIKLDEKHDPFDKLIQLKKDKAILRANLVTCSSMLIYYDDRKVSEADLLRITKGTKTS
jgi:hypothetical protein